MSAAFDAAFTREARMGVKYRIIFREGGWMIAGHGQLYGPYSSQQEAVHEAVYVANYSTSHGLQAEVIVQKNSQGSFDRLIPAFRTIIQHIAAPY